MVEKKAGADGSIAAQSVATADADGYTLFVTAHSSQAANVSLLSPYDPLKDFTPISRLTSEQFILAVNASVPVKTIDELVAYIKANPGKLSYATANTTSTVAMAWLAALKDLDVVRVNYASAPLEKSSRASSHGSRISLIDAAAAGTLADSAV